MKRRTMLLGGASVAGACAAGYGAIVAAGATRRCAADDALAALSRHAAMASLGARYLVQASALERAELFDIAQGPVAVVAEFAALMAAQAEADFENGNLISCDGWVLARGEARSCALIALAYARSNQIGLPGLEM
jgi:hypothetical protein